MVRGFDAQQMALINVTDLKMNLHSSFPSRDWVHRCRPHFGVTVVANPHRGHSTTSSSNPILFVPKESKPLSLLGSKVCISISFVSVTSLLAFIWLLLSVSFVRALFSFTTGSGVCYFSASRYSRTISCLVNACLKVRTVS